MTSPNEGPNRPGVFARLAEEAEIRHVSHTPTRAARWFGWGICVALVLGTVVGALQANPW